jgi:NADPH:quinone reductase-like Zn-dependent oxidoreductase
MMAIEIQAFGGLDALRYVNVPIPVPSGGQVLVRVLAAGVGAWDAWVRAGASMLPQPLPLVLGAEIAGVVEAVGPEVWHVAQGDAVYGVTNARFTGGYAEFALAEAAMVAHKPARLSYIEAASVPVVASTAWQMLLERASARAGESVLVLGGGGNVGGYVVQLARWHNMRVAATASPAHADTVRALGAQVVVDSQTTNAVVACSFDIVIDTVGGDALESAYRLLRPGGIVVSAVATPDQTRLAQRGARGEFLLVSVTAVGLDRLSALFDSAVLKPRIGEVLPLSAARNAHDMLAGREHRPGKIVLLPGS